MLLHRPSQTITTDSSMISRANTCSSCASFLRRNKTPPLSLANGMWVGDIPFVLRVLTLPERILVARYFPAAYVVKLYPMKKGARSWSVHGLHSGLRGNVSTYHLNTDDIASMTDSQIMPPSSAILAAIIGVTFVGPKNLPQKTMPGFLRVNRVRVHDALLWLKRNNPIYENIVISPSRLEELPLDGIPLEISALAKHSDDPVRLAKERDGYVPENDECDQSFPELDDDENPSNEDDVDETCFTTDSGMFLLRLLSTLHLICKDATAIPLCSLGVVDVAANDVKENEVLAHALHNISQTEKTEAWIVRQGNKFINEYAHSDANGVRTDGAGHNPNHLLGSFPCLFPYGFGGFEVDRPTSVSYETHAQWALRYDDKRFRTDLHFMFQVFGVLQKRRLCAAAALQISRPTFIHHEAAIRSLRSSDFETAAVEEQSHHAFSNPTMQSLRGNINSVRAKVMGTDESRIKIRSLIWGMCVKKNPPSLWLTINPADTQDPIAQVLCGKDIDLDRFDAIDHQVDAAAVTADPFASAQFFHLVINAVLRELLGIQCMGPSHSLQRKKGILGCIEGYIGTVEAQGRGTLHLHMVLWLSGSITSPQMKQCLLSEQFREKLRRFISMNIRADLPNVVGAAVLSQPKDPAVAFSRPIDPRSPNYKRRSCEAEKRIARTVQIHQCGRGCMKLVNGHWVCKRRTPFALADAAWVDENGLWGPKRSYGYFNNFCPTLLQCLRANHDIKLISNGADTKHISWYITQYVAKKQKQSMNTSALLANTYAFHEGKEQRNRDLALLNKRLIQRCANTLTRQQELSAPEVVSYLLGWGDRFISHHFETIHWYAVAKMLKQIYPALQSHQYACTLPPLSLIIDNPDRHERPESTLHQEESDLQTHSLDQVCIIQFCADLFSDCSYQLFGRMTSLTSKWSKASYWSGTKFASTWTEEMPWKAGHTLITFLELMTVPH